MPHVSFCFLVTKDLNKEHIWRSWLDQLDISYSLFVHCSNPEKITSPWLQSFIIPRNKIVPTAWGKLGQATYNLFEHAYKTSKADWYTMNSESCVPIIPAAQFSHLCREYSNKSMLSYCDAWWDPNTCLRGNLRQFAKEYHLAHSGWYILTMAHIKDIIKCKKDYPQFTYNALFDTNTLMADESGIAIILKKMNNLTNIICESTTIVDWARGNGNSPYTFAEDSDQNRQYIEDARKQYSCFLRKVAASFPDEIIMKYL